MLTLWLWSMLVMVQPQPLKIDSCFVLPHDTVVCRLSDSIDYIIATYPGQPHYVTVCDTIRIGNHWLYRVIRGKDTSVWLQKKLK